MLHDNIIFLTNNKKRRRSNACHGVYVEALLKVRVRLSLVTVAGVYLAVLCVIRLSLCVFVLPWPCCVVCHIACFVYPIA